MDEKQQVIMRFTQQKKLKDNYIKGVTKVDVVFLWWPATIDGETRWLELTTIEYKVDYEDTVFFGRVYKWIPWTFLNE
jgi:hypothetical protein